MKGENAMVVEGIGREELVHPQLEEFIRESERNRVISIFATKNKSVFTANEVIALICGFEVNNDAGMSL
jgi:hypothetical protein